MLAEESKTSEEYTSMNSLNVDSISITTIGSNDKSMQNLTLKTSQLKSHIKANSTFQLKNNGTYPEELQNSAEKIFKSKELYIVLFLCFPIGLWLIVHFSTKMCC